MADETDTTKPPRRQFRPLQVCCTPEERAQIEANAQAANMSVSSYLRALGTGYSPKSALDYTAVRDLMKEGADLRRYGGLLKMWLADDRRLKAHGEAKVRGYIETVMTRTEQISARMRAIIDKIVPVDDQ